MKNIGIAYFDCFSGISGDMVLGALVDAGADLRAIEAELRKLNLPGWTISAQKVQRRAIFATQRDCGNCRRSPRLEIEPQGLKPLRKGMQECRT